MARGAERALAGHNPPSFERHEPGIKVTARVVFDRDGEQWLGGLAQRWGAGHVYVHIRDDRRGHGGVRPKPEDVYRNHEAS